MDEITTNEILMDEAENIPNNTNEVGIENMELDANVSNVNDVPYSETNEEINTEVSNIEPSLDAPDMDIPLEPPVYYDSKSGVTITEDDFKWYCLKTYNSYEDRVKKALDSEVKRLGLGYCIREVVVPLETVFEVRNGKKKTKLRNFLAGYILVNAAISEHKKTKKKIIDLVTDISGVVAFVGRKNDPVALQPAEVERIFSRIHERSDVATIDTLFRKGDPIAVLEGPFSGFKGTVIDIANEKQKVKVEITILGRKTPVELSFDQVQFDKPV